MPHETLDMLVAPGTTPLGREVCRLGRAADHEMTSLAAEGRPDRDAPWLQGVAWASGSPTNADAVASAAAGRSTLILLPPDGDGLETPAIGGEPLRRLLGQSEESGADRLVYVTVGHRSDSAPPTDAERLVVDGDDQLAGGQVAIRLPAIEADAAVVERTDQGDAGGNHSDRRCPPIPIGQAAMAVLRAAAEPDTSGMIGCRAATKLGYAVMIQQ